MTEENKNVLPKLESKALTDSTGSVPTLTKEQAVIITGFTGYAACSLSELQEDVEKRLGRPVWTHEFADEDVRKKIRDAYRGDFVAMCPKDSFSQNDEHIRADENKGKS